MRIERLIEGPAILGESPLWDVEQQRLYWVDSKGRRVHRATIDGRELETWTVPDTIGSLAITEDGRGAIIALADRFARIDLGDGSVEPLVLVDSAGGTTRLNDGKVDAGGSFICGSMDVTAMAPLGTLYRLDPDLSLQTLESGIIVSNGPCWSPDGTTFYFSDTRKAEIRAYDYDHETGTPSNPRVFVNLQGQKGRPDGSTVDSEGCLWSAQIFAGELHRYTPDGTLDRRIEMPVNNVTSVMFAGPDLDILCVTSAGRPPQPDVPEDGPMAGSLFAIHGLGIRGVPPFRFEG